MLGPSTNRPSTSTSDLLTDLEDQTNPGVRPAVSTRYGPGPTSETVSTNPRLDPVADYYAKPSPQGLRAVIDHINPTIESALRNYAKSPSPVVRQRARILAAQAVQGFDPNRGAQLTTHVYRQLQRLQREAPQLTDPMPMPERIRHDSRDIINALADAGELLGTEISDEQVSEATGIPVPRVTKVRRLMRKGISESAYDEGLGEDDDDTPDVVASSTEPYDEWVDAVYHDLGEVDRVIMSYRTGYRGAPTLSNIDIAKRLKMSPAAVSQRASKIQARLDEFYV